MRTALREGIYVPQDATLELATVICQGRFAVSPPSSWPHLHAQAKMFGYTLIPSARIGVTDDPILDVMKYRGVK